MTHRGLGEPQKTILTKEAERPLGRWWIEVISDTEEERDSQTMWRAISANREVMCFGTGYNSPDNALETITGLFGEGVEVRFFVLSENHKHLKEVEPE